MFHVVDKMSASLFDLLGCQGTNLLIQSGKEAGQVSESLAIRIIPRFENDSLNLKWTPKPASPEELDGLVKSFKDLEENNKKTEMFEQQQKEIQKKKEPETLSKDNYLLKSIRRNP